MTFRGKACSALALSLLAAMFFWAGGAAAADRDRAPELSLRLSALLGERANRLAAVDAELDRSGYTHTPAVQRMAGFELGATARRLRFEIGFVATLGDRVYSLTTGESVRVHRGWLSPEIGYDVYRYGHFAVFPMLGYASGHLLVQMRCDQPPLFAAYFSPPNECSRSVRRGFDAFKLVVGVEDVIPLWHRWIEDGGLVFGLRLGYVAQLGQSSWRTGDIEDTAIHGGPDADVSGPFMLLNVGISVFKP